MKADCTIIVSSCDAYADCWEPFFQLLARYWPGLNAPIILITDEMDYACSHVNVKTFRAAKGQYGRRRPWGWNLRHCLESLDDDLILYLQEDFFLTGPVDDSLIEEFAGYMTEMSWTHEFTMHIGLCPRSSHGPFHVTENPLLWEVGNDARYRFSLQPGLWKRKELLNYIKTSDTAWAFEEVSHIRARRTPERVLTVNRHVFHPGGKIIYPFDPHGGIVRGKWVRGSVVDLFKQHGIEADFSQRGFSDEMPAKISASSFPHRIHNAIHWRWLRLKGQINESLDRFRY